MQCEKYFRIRFRQIEGAFMKRYFFSALLIVAILSISLMALAQGGHRGHHGDMGKNPPPPGEHFPGGHLLGQLGLTEEQHSKVQAIMVSERPIIQPLMAASFQSMKQLQTLATSGNFTEAQARTIAQAQAKNMVSMVVEHHRVQSEIYAVLTPDQQKKFDELSQSRPDHKPPMEGGNFFVKMLTHRLDLTTDQQTQVEQIFSAERTAAATVEQNLANFHQQVASATAGGHFDEQQIRTLAEAQIANFAEVAVLHAGSQAKIYSLLTPEQKTKFSEMHGPEHGPGRGMRPPMGEF